MKWAWMACLCASSALGQTQLADPQPRGGNVEFKLGGYKPMIDSEAGLSGTPYADIFGNGVMLLGELEFERYFWERYGAVGAGASIGYAEKYGNAVVVGTGSANVRTSLKVLPVRLMGIYRLDYWTQHFGFPLVPYGKLGLVWNPWWVSKGSETVEYVNGIRGAGAKWGFELVGGLSLMLDFIEPKLAHDFHTDLGVAHSYLFGEFTYSEVNNFGKAGLDFSGRYWMFGLAFEY